MRALAIVLVAGCNQILGGNISGPSGDDTSPPDDGGVADGEHVDDAGTGEGGDGGVAGCAWSALAQIAPFAAHPSIAGSPAGDAYVVYDNTTTSMAFASRRPGMAWTSPSVMTDRTHGNVAVDHTGSIHLLARSTGSAVAYQSRTAQGAWSTASVASTLGWTTVLGIAPFGPVAAFTSGLVRWGRPSASAWNFAMVSTSDISVTFAPNDVLRPAIASSDHEVHLLALSARFDENFETVSTIEHSVHSVGVWTTTVIDVGTSVAPDPFGLAVAVAATPDTAHLLYSSGTGNTQHLMYRNHLFGSVSAAFAPDTAPIDAIVAVVDASATLHVVTHDWAADNLRYQRRSAGAWSSPSVLAGTSGGADVTLAIDGTGALHLAWTDPQKHLQYATRCTSP